MKFGQWELES